MSDTKSILACPFCGEDGVPGVGTGAFYGKRREYAVVRCRNLKCKMMPETPSVIAGVCNGQEDKWPNAEQAADAWNSRALTSALLAVASEWRRDAEMHRNSCRLQEQAGQRDKADRHYQRSLDLDACAKRIEDLANA